MEKKEIYEASIEGLDEISEISSTDSESGADDGLSEHHHGHHHRSHHHHSHHHTKRSRRRNKNSKKQNEFLDFLKKNRSVLINIIACSISVVLLILLAFGRDRLQDNTSKENIVDITQSSIKVESSVYVDKVPLVSQAILTYMDKSNPKTPREISKMLGGDMQELSFGLPLKYTYMVSGLPSGVMVEKAVLEVSENEAFNKFASYDLATNGDDIEIYHLKPDTNYHYRLRLTLTSGTEVGTTGDFTTVASPRILNIEGAVNARDIGGWETVYGKKIKHGLLYRGSELDGAVEPSYLLTEKGLSDMLLTLGIRFDMDLRGVHESNADPLGANVLHKFYSISMYSNIFNEIDNERVRSIFSDLSNKDNYPVYMHCTYGVDRTGTICYLLEALLGVSDDDLRREYELSAFKGHVSMEEFASFVTRINMFEGDTTKEKVEGYLLSIGVTEEQMENIRNIFLGE